jgi:nitrate/nitrite transport system permease protein
MNLGSVSNQKRHVSIMSTIAEIAAPATETAADRRQRRFAAIGRYGRYLDLLGLGWGVPLLRMAAGDSPRTQGKALLHQLGVPVAAIVLFLALWAGLAPKVHTSLGTLPGPAQVWTQARLLYADHLAEREKQRAFFARQSARNADLLAKNPKADVKIRPYTGKPTYLDQIATSLETVFTGFLLATLVAVPLGILCGLSKIANAAVNPLVQLFKPVSPLAWLPIVTMVVSALYVSDDPTLPKSFLISAITVTLCSLWPTLINTAVGVASIDRDLVNVGRVLRLSWRTSVLRIVLPSSLPYIFTGLRLSLGVGWMVLIAAEMLAQNPGLGKFVWDEFQNGSSESLAKIIVAVLTIGIIGFLLDRVMLAFQASVTHQTSR